MKGGRYFLIAGASILAIGIIVAAIPLFQLANWSLPDNVVVEDWQLGPKESKVLSLQVINTTKSLTAIVFAKDLVEVHAIVTDPEGKVIVDSTFTKSKSFDFEPTGPGTYTIRITNEGNSPTLIDAFFRHPQVAGGEGKLEIEPLANIFSSGVKMAIIGFIVMIIGAFLAIYDKRKGSANRSPV